MDNVVEVGAIRTKNDQLDIIQCNDVLVSVVHLLFHSCNITQMWHRIEVNLLVRIRELFHFTSKFYIILHNILQFQYKGKSSRTRAVPFQILWGKNKHALDNPDMIQGRCEVIFFRW